MAGSGRPVASPGTSGSPVASTPPVANAIPVTASAATSVALPIASMPPDSRGHASEAIVAPGIAGLLVAAGELLEFVPVEVAGALLGFEGPVRGLPIPVQPLLLGVGLRRLPDLLGLSSPWTLAV